MAIDHCLALHSPPTAWRLGRAKLICPDDLVLLAGALTTSALARGQHDATARGLAQRSPTVGTGTHLKLLSDCCTARALSSDLVYFTLEVGG